MASCGFSSALSDDYLLKLKEKAAQLGVVPEELVRFSIEELLARPADEAFKRAVAYALQKNAELYQRLA